MLNVVKNTMKCGVFDIVCPHRCRGCGNLGGILCECCKNDIISTRVNICPKCGKVVLDSCMECELPFSEVFCFGYRDEIIGRMAEEFKFFGVRAIGKVIAEIVSEGLPDIQGEVRIVPLPTIRKHIRERGVDHTDFVVKKIAKSKGWKISRVLERAKDTVQIGKDAKTRKKQAKEAYKIVSREKILSEATYLLFDDVWTTGASMCEAEKLLQEAGAKKIIAVILVKASRPRKGNLGCSRKVK